MQSRLRIMRESLARRSRARQRRGTAMVLLAVCLIPLLACVALAIDVGMLSMAQTQLNDAADAAAMAGARTLNGNSATNNNYSSVAPTAQQVIGNNSILGIAITNAQLSLNIGRYVYNSTAQQFQGQFPGPSTQNWNMVQATVTSTQNNLKGFSKIFNFLPSLQAVSTAAHQPRDVCLILDYSGSMRFGSLVGLPYSGTRTAGNNLNPVYPQFGAYSSSNAGIQGTAPASPYLDANIDWTTSDGRPPIAQDFYTSSTGGAAFSAAPSSYATTPAGDIPLKTSKNSGGSYAQTLWGTNGLLSTSSPTSSTRDATFESQGYKAYSMASKFNGYTQGPGYWGKTFYIWPPDPTNDWRSKYFTFSGGSPDNSALWDSNGNWQAPGGSAPYYNVNYNAILNFILNVGPNPFPSRLQSGRIVYYTAIPTTINTSTWPPTDLNQRFWKDYIDYVLGLMQTGSSSYTVINSGNTGLTGYGMDFSWGTAKITAASSLSGSPKPYMYYGDNPLRPQLSFWFGPLTMIDFLGNYNLWYSVNPNCSRYCWWPGTCHEAPMYACKVGINSALNDIQTNHPNDMLSMIFFSAPQSSATDTSGTRFNRVRVALGQNYTNLVESLWYPPATLGNSSATVTPYDSNNLEVPRAMGGTCYAMGLMLAYNQFSSNTSLQTFNPGQTSGDAGGNGRQGAQKIVIFETDGAPNTTASANFVSSSAYQSYYQVRYNSTNPSASDFPNNINGYNDNDPTVTAQIYSICTQMAATTTAGGFSTSSHPVLIHCLAFGPQGINGVPTLNQMQTIGNVTDGMPSYKIINGNSATIIANLQTAIDTILEDGVQVSLIQ
jgi:Flp pilus assembly protein TadG